MLSLCDADDAEPVQRLSPTLISPRAFASKYVTNADMGIDFRQLGGGDQGAGLVEPRQIFAALPAKEKRYAYLRDVQGEVLAAWFERRDDRDLVVKMNTGGGKTVVGLLCLASSLNERKGPALYLAADRYLASQALAEARALGLSCTAEPQDADFLGGRSICIATVQRLFNGRSVFGTSTTGVKIPLGSVVVDDAHACLASIREQFTISAAAGTDLYDGLLGLFSDSIELQSRAKLLELQDGDPSALARIPSWAWVEREKDLVALLHASRSEDSLLFTWDLLKDALPLCVAAVDSRRFEIAPSCVPVDRIPSFARATRRIYLSATLSDDSVLVTDVGANVDSVSRSITPATASDMGDRMILSPFETHPSLTSVDVHTLVAGLAERENVVVIVPSHRRAEAWQDVASFTLTAANLDEGVAALKTRHVGLVVLVNKYDGVDLPQGACRVLVIDGVPSALGPIEKFEATALDGTDHLVSRQMQRVEQGMGRAVRSNDDYCVVIIADAAVATHVYGLGARRFGPATLAQVELSRDLARMLEGTELTAVGEAAQRCLDRDADWVAASRARLAAVSPSAAGQVSNVAMARRRAFDLADRGRFQDAVTTLQDAADELGDLRIRGWIKQEAASYAQRYDPVAARNLQRSARDDNVALLRPRDADVAYRRLTAASSQASSATALLSERYATRDELLLGINALLESLVPDPDNTSAFEQAMADLGTHLGFESQRPERDLGNGPDVLWLVGELRFVVVECKSGSSADRISRSDVEQLSHSMDWFVSQYDQSCEATPILVHPSRELRPDAVARVGARVMTFDRLNGLRAAVRGFAISLASRTEILEADVKDRLAEFGLLAGQLVERWTISPIMARRT